MSKTHKQIFFDVCVHLKEVKDCMSGKNEYEVIKVIESLDYKLGKDYFRQYPIGDKFVLDFAFPNEQIAIEVDGPCHREKEQKIIDKKRDNFLYSNNWVVIRVDEKKFFGGKALFYKYLIKEVVIIRRKQWASGKLYKIDIPDFKEE